MSGESSVNATTAFGLPASSTASVCMDAVCQTSQVVKDTLEEHGSLSIEDYAATLLKPAKQGLQDREDFEKTIFDQVAALFDAQLAQRTAQQLRETPVVLTANHHGVDYFAQSVQGTLALSRSEAILRGPGVVVVLACGTVPLDNLTYPQGMLIYDTNDDPLARMPRKVPVIANSRRRQLVSAAASMDLQSVQRSVTRLNKLMNQGDIHHGVGIAAVQILDEIYSSDAVLGCSTLSAQASIINHRIWERLFDTPATDLVYLELERVTGDLIRSDLQNADSLNSRLLLDHDVRATVLNALDKSANCWDLDVLQQRSDEPTPAGGGTVLFWAVTNKGRPVALRLDDSQKPAVLSGVDAKGQRYTFEMQADLLDAAIRTGDLVPSLFMSFLNLTLLRGVACLGGYYQAEYLPAMARGLDIVFGKHPELTPRHAHDSTDVGSEYLSGMQMVVAESCGGLVPAGPLEILAGGSLSADDLAKIDQISVEAAHFGSLLESVGDLPVASTFNDGWQTALARDLMNHLSHDLVIKHL